MNLGKPIRIAISEDCDYKQTMYLYHDTEKLPTACISTVWNSIDSMKMSHE